MSFRHDVAELATGLAQPKSDPSVESDFFSIVGTNP
jgi:hypothetical protein